MYINKCTLIVPLLLLSASVQAVTMEELHEMQKNRYAETLKQPTEREKAAQAVATAAKAGPVNDSLITDSPGSSSAIKGMRLTGLYGVGSDIEAKIAYRGASIPLKLGMDIDGWVLTDIGDRWVDMTQATSAPKGKKASKPKTVKLRITNVIRDYSSPVANQFSGMPSPLPSVPPLPLPRGPLP